MQNKAGAPRHFKVNTKFSTKFVEFGCEQFCSAGSLWYPEAGTPDVEQRKSQAGFSDLHEYHPKEVILLWR